MVDRTPHVVIVGAGFGGLRAARALARAPVRVTLVDRKNYHLFQPFLYQVATAALSPADIAQPVRAILRKQHNLEFNLSEVQQVDLEKRRLVTDTGDILYDYLILAMGGQTNSFGIESIARNAHGLKDIDDSVGIRNHILRMFELAALESDLDRCRAMRTFVIAGGGPTGVECSGAISELVRLVLKKDYPGLNINDVRIILLEGASQLLAGMPSQLSEYTEKALWSKHVEVHFNSMVTGYDGSQISLKGGEVIPACTLIWAAGVRASRLADTLGTSQTRLGQLEVDETLHLHEYPEVYVIGDAAAFPNENGQPLPMVAPVAMQQAKVAARNIQRAIQGKLPEKFIYRDPGSLATIGRNAAVARLGRWQFTGFIAWLLWLGVHILQLIGFRNRLVVLINWAWDYLFYDRPIRLITPE